MTASSANAAEPMEMPFACGLVEAQKTMWGRGSLHRKENFLGPNLGIPRLVCSQYC